MWTGYESIYYSIIYTRLTMMARTSTWSCYKILKFGVYQACTTYGPTVNCKLLVKFVCERAPKSLFWVPPVYQDLSMRHDWSVGIATCTSPIMRIICSPKFCITFAFHFSWVLQPFQEKLKTMLMQYYAILAGGNPCTWLLVTALCDYALPEHWLVILNARTIWKNLNLAEENWFEQDANISPFTLSSSKMRLIASIDSFPEWNVKERLLNE